MMKEMFHVIRQTLRSAYLSMVGTFAKPAVGIHIISGHRIEDELEPDTFRKLLSNLSKICEIHSHRRCHHNDRK